MNYLKVSDKYFWHRYTDSYLLAFSKIPKVEHILEFGIFLGNSISWLRHEFPSAQILGLDIQPQKDIWPIDQGIEYSIVDQGDRRAIEQLLNRQHKFYDLVIEDGSHHPKHQFNSLISSIPWMNKGSVYIIEDIHTCLTEMRTSRLIRPAMNRVYLREVKYASLVISYLLIFPRKIIAKLLRPRKQINILSILLILERNMYLGRNFTEIEIEEILEHGNIEKWELELILERVKRIELVKRVGLPLSCYECGSMQFQISILKCKCGRPLYEDDESMSVILSF